MVEKLNELILAMKPEIINLIVISLVKFTEILTGENIRKAVGMLVEGLAILFHSLMAINEMLTVWNGNIVKFAAYLLIAIKVAGPMAVAMYNVAVATKVAGFSFEMFNMALMRGVFGIMLMTQSAEPMIQMIGALASLMAVGTMGAWAYSSSLSAVGLQAGLLAAMGGAGAGVRAGKGFIWGKGATRQFDTAGLVKAQAQTTGAKGYGASKIKTQYPKAGTMGRGTRMLSNIAKWGGKMPKWVGGTGPWGWAAMAAITAATIGAGMYLGTPGRSDREGAYQADTGMFYTGGRSIYDTGGIAPRHQLAYVEPGEQIISKTQGMVGMGGGINVYVGDVYAQDGTDFADKLAEALPRALRKSSYGGSF